MHIEPQRAASFYGSPHEALQAPPEEFLYLACLHEGTGVEKPDFLAVVDAERGADRARDADAERRRRAAPLRLEPLQLRLPRARPLAPDRARASAPRGSTSSTSPTTRGAPRIEKVIERGRARRQDRLHAPAHRPLHAGRQRRRQHARRRRGKRRLWLRRPRREDVRGQGPLGERRRDSRRSTTTSGTSRARTCSSPREFGEPNAYEPGFDLADVEAGRYGQPPPLLESGRAEARADRRPRRERAASVRGALEARSRGGGGLRRRRALEHDVALPARQRRLGAPTR